MFYVHNIFLNLDLLSIESKVIFFKKHQLYATLQKNTINHISLQNLFIKEINTPYLHPYLSIFYRMEVKSYTV